MIRLIAIAALLFGFGCGKPDMKKKYGKKLAPKLEQMAKLAEPSRGNTLAIGWPEGDVAGIDLTEETGNTVMVIWEDLVDVHQKSDPRIHFLADSSDSFRMARQVAFGVPGGLEDGVLHAFEKNLKVVERAKYALVVVVDEATMPSMKAFSEGVFVPGRVKGAGLLYDIEKAELLGGFQFEATNSEKTTASEGGEEKKLEDDLRYHMGDEMNKALVKRFPSAKVQSYLGYVSW